jgi:hypothetical protein
MLDCDQVEKCESTMGTALTRRQQLFINEFLVDPCATRAALRAGYSARNDLVLRPYLHAVVSDSGFSACVWVAPRRSHFLPARVVMAKVPGKFIAGVRACLQRRN